MNDARRAREAADLAEQAILETIEEAGDDALAERVREHFAIGKKITKLFTVDEP